MEEIATKAKANHYDLTPSEVSVAIKPKVLANRSLDEKLIIASKLNKRVVIVLIDKDPKKAIGNKEFSQIFRQTFISTEQNKKAAELMEDSGLVIIGNETISRYLQRAELFLNSDFIAVTKAIKRIRAKKGFVKQTFRNDELSLKELFMHTVLRMFFCLKPMQRYLEVMQLALKEFAILATLWMDSRPLSNETIRLRVNKLCGTTDNDLRSSFKHMALKGYIVREDRESTHVKRKQGIFMLTNKGHDTIFQFIERVTQESMSNVYE